MKKALLIIFVLFSLNSYSQLSLKAMGYLFYFDYRLASSAACGIEYQHKQFGYEYKYQTYCNDGSTSFEYNLHQLTLKYYFKQRNEMTPRYKFYSAAFVLYKDMTALEDMEIQDYGSRADAKGLGLGLMLGDNLSLGKHMGIDLGLYSYYQFTNQGTKFKNSGSTFSHLSSDIKWGLRFLLFYKIY